MFRRCSKSQLGWCLLSARHFYRNMHGLHPSNVNSNCWNLREIIFTCAENILFLFCCFFPINNWIEILLNLFNPAEHNSIDNANAGFLQFDQSSCETLASVRGNVVLRDGNCWENMTLWARLSSDTIVDRDKSARLDGTSRLTSKFRLKFNSRCCSFLERLFSVWQQWNHWAIKTLRPKMAALASLSINKVQYLSEPSC